MQVAHGGSLNLFDAFDSHRQAQPVDGEFPSDFTSNDESLTDEFLSDVVGDLAIVKDVCLTLEALSADDVSVASSDDALAVSNAATDCVGNIVLRNHLLKISSYLQNLVSDKVIVHNDSVASRIGKRLSDDLESKAFITFDVEHLVNQWAGFKDMFPDVVVSVRAGAVNRSLLAALVDVLGVRVTFESKADIALLSGCAEDISKVNSFSPASVCPTDLGSLGSIDSAVLRAPSRIRASLSSGNRLMCVGSLSGITAIAAAALAHAGGSPRSGNVKANSPRVSSLPSLVLCLKAKPCVAEAVSLAPGSSFAALAQVSFTSADIPVAMATAARCGLSVAGLRVDIESLLDGSAEAAVELIARSPAGLSVNASTPFTVLIDEFDPSLLLVSGCVPIEDSEQFAARIRSAIDSLTQLFDAGMCEVVIDTSSFLFSSTCTLLTRVIGVRPSVDDEGECIGRQYYIDDGIYGSLCKASGSVAAHSSSAVMAFTVGSSSVIPCVTGSLEATSCLRSSTDLPCTIWGQTCDSIDKVLAAESGVVPASMGLGDWFAFAGITMTGSTTNTGFNGYDGPAVRYMIHVGFEM